MKEILKSVRIFTAQQTITSMLTVLAGFLSAYVFIALLGVVVMFTEKADPDSFFSGFISGFVPSFTVLIPAAGVFFLSAIYNYNQPITPGYKYFHSLHDSEEHFKRAIIGANIIALLTGVVGTGINAVLQIFVPEMLNILLSPAVCLLGTGLMNFSGHIKNSLVRFIMIMPIFMGVGFLTGYMSSAEEDGEILPDTVLIIAVIVSALVYIAGLVFTLIRCKASWRSDK